MFDTGFDPIPDGLDEMAPGPVLGALLSSIDVSRVSGHDRVVVLRAAQRQASFAQAQVFSAMTAVADCMDEEYFSDDPALAWEAAATEIRAALRLTRRAAETELGLALEVGRRLPAVGAALATGHIDRRRAWTIAQGTGHLDEAIARRVADTILPDAARYTTGQLAARIRRLCIQSDPESAAQRYRAGLDDRRMVLDANDDGTANLYGLSLPPDAATTAASHIDRIAKTLNRNGDARTLDQLRADVYIDLLCGTAHAGKGGGIVELRVDLATLTELTQTPGELAGYGPVIADIARQVTAAHTDGQWRFTITDPHTGLPIHDGTTRRRPTAAQRRSVTARDTTCIFPGCRVPATQCDLDHTTPWTRRRHTSTAGLTAACRYDHITVRHLIGWTHRPLPGGDHLWTSPLGHHYTTSGKPYEPP